MPSLRAQVARWAATDVERWATALFDVPGGPTGGCWTPELLHCATSSSSPTHATAALLAEQHMDGYALLFYADAIRNTPLCQSALFTRMQADLFQRLPLPAGPGARFLQALTEIPPPEQSSAPISPLAVQEAAPQDLVASEEPSQTEMAASLASPQQRRFQPPTRQESARLPSLRDSRAISVPNLPFLAQPVADGPSLDDPRLRYWINVCTVCCLALTPGKKAALLSDSAIIQSITDQLQCDAARFIGKVAITHHANKKLSGTKRRVHSFGMAEIAPFDAADQRPTLLLFLRGTKDKDDLMKDLKFFGKRDKAVGGTVHSGFLERASTVPLDYVRRYLREGGRVVITGHSLGGAVAQIITQRLLIELAAFGGEVESRLQCITFGQPLVGDAKLRNRFRTWKDCFISVVHQNDPIPVLGSAGAVLDVVSSSVATVKRQQSADMIVRAGRSKKPKNRSSLKMVLTPSVLPFGFTVVDYVAHGHYVILESNQGKSYHWHVLHEDGDLDNYLTSNQISKYKEQHSLKSSYCSFLLNIFKNLPPLELANAVPKSKFSAKLQTWDMQPTITSIKLQAVSEVPDYYEFVVEGTYLEFCSSAVVHAIFPEQVAEVELNLDLSWMRDGLDSDTTRGSCILKDLPFASGPFHEQASDCLATVHSLFLPEPVNLSHVHVSLSKPAAATPEDSTPARVEMKKNRKFMRKILNKVGVANANKVHKELKKQYGDIGLTKRSIGELTKIYQKTAKQAPDQGLVESEFSSALRLFRTSEIAKSQNVDAMLSSYSERLFSLLDTDGNGFLSHQEFLVGLGCRLCGGTMDEKIQLCFDLFDANQNNEIDQDELREMIYQTYHMGISVIMAMSPQGKSALMQTLITKHSEKCAGAWAAMIFTEMDADGDGVISRGEFMRYIHALKDAGESEETSVSLMVFASCFSDVQNQIATVFEKQRAGLPRLLSSSDTEKISSAEVKRLEFLQFYFHQNEVTAEKLFALTNLCEVSVLEMFNAFRAVTNENGMISRTGYEAALKQLEQHGLRYGQSNEDSSGDSANVHSHQFFCRLFSMLDMDGGVGLSLTEIVAGLLDFCQGKPRDRLWVTFEAADDNHDGVLDPTELRNFYKLRTQGSVVTLLALSPEPPSTDELHQIFNDLAVNYELPFEKPEGYTTQEFVQRVEIEERFAAGIKSWYTMLT